MRPRSSGPDSSQAADALPRVGGVTYSTIRRRAVPAVSTGVPDGSAAMDAAELHQARPMGSGDSRLDALTAIEDRWRRAYAVACDAAIGSDRWLAACLKLRILEQATDDVWHDREPDELTARHAAEAMMEAQRW